MRRKHDLRWHWRTLLIAVVLGGLFEVIDNLLGLRTLNFESSAPAVVKVAKELAIACLMLGAVRRWGMLKTTQFGLAVFALTLTVFVPALFALPHETFAQLGFIYFALSVAMMLMACALVRPGMEADFERNFILPLMVITLATQLLEAWLSPGSLYFESNLLGLDRRAGIAVIPTTAGLFGVVAFAGTNRFSRVLGLLVLAMANSTLSLLCLVIVAIARGRHRLPLVLALPAIVGLGAVAIAWREGLDVSLVTRLIILEDAISTLEWFGPSPVGALATAKSVALSPSDSYIADSLYLEMFHVLGIVPGAVLIGTLFATLFRRVGGLAVAVFAIAGVGYLTLEAWPVWIAIVFGLQRAQRRWSGSMVPSLAPLSQPKPSRVAP